MAFIKWDDKFLTGVSEADNQHKKLVKLINELYDTMKQGKEQNIIGKIIDELAKYAIVHFSTEEKLMQKYGYPGLANHKREHEIFIQKVEEFKKEQAEGKITLSIKVLNFLKDWLINHIMGTDKEYGPFLTSRMK